MTQHTPGPWKLQRISLFESGEDDTGWEVVGANGDTVCDNQTYYPHAISHPDARLIAAAPELLEALGELADAVADGSEIKRLTKAVGQAGKVLAKAETL